MTDHGLGNRTVQTTVELAGGHREVVAVEVPRIPTRLSPDEARAAAAELMRAAESADAEASRLAANDYFPLHRDGELSIVNLLRVVEDTRNANVAVHGAPAAAVQLFTNGHLGVDLLYAHPNGSFPLHVHPGHHLLYIVKGEGTITFGGVPYKTVPGDLYMVEGMVEHAVGAGPEGQWIAAFGAPHKRADAHDRMREVPLEEATSSTAPIGPRFDQPEVPVGDGI